MKTKFLKKIKFDIIEVSSTLLCINCPWFYSTELSVCCIYSSKTVFKFPSGAQQFGKSDTKYCNTKELTCNRQKYTEYKQFGMRRVLVGIRSRSRFWHSLNASLQNSDYILYAVSLVYGVRHDGLFLLAKQRSWDLAHFTH